VTEKPDIARQFSAALGASLCAPFTYVNTQKMITVTHCRGHLLELAQADRYDLNMRRWNYKSLPVIPSVFRYEVKKEKGIKDILKTVSVLLKKAVREQDEIVIATDAGREGEVIARLVLQYAQVDGYRKLSRFWVSESVAEPKVVITGLMNRKPLSEYDEIGLLGLTWKKCDWIFGINLTVLYSLLARETMYVGRVQTAVLYEIREREKTIEKFVPRKYRELRIETAGGLVAYLVKPKTNDRQFEENSEYIKKALDMLKMDGRLQIVNKEVVEEERMPPLLYATSDLYREAYRLYGFAPSKTASVMQKLYEEKGVLSYPRTPSRVLGEGNEAIAQEWIKEQMAHETALQKVIDTDKYRVVNKRLFNNTKLEDHYGLVPLKYMEKEDSDYYKIWRLVQLRFLMQGMKSNIEEDVTVTLERGAYRFQGKYKRVKQQGWKMLETKKKEKKNEPESNVKIELQKGMVEMIEKMKIEEKCTEPPLLYTYDTIMGFMQNPKNESGTNLTGIGTEATRANIIKALETHNLIVGGKFLKSGDKGKKLLEYIAGNDLLAKNIRAEETTNWEVLGNENPALLLGKTTDLVRKVVKNMEAVMTVETERETLGKCPKCGGDMYEGQNSYYCSNYNKEGEKCKVHLAKKILGNTFDKKAAMELFRTGETGLLKGITKEGNTVEFRLVYDKKQEDIIPVYEGDMPAVGKCPVCGRDVFTGKKSYFCSGYKDEENPCTWSLWKNTVGTDIDFDMAKRLLNREILENVAFFTKEGKEYAGGLKLKDDGTLVKIEYGGTKKE
jgi:DNA topoisomerase-3